MKTHTSNLFEWPFAALAGLFNRRPRRERRKKTLFRLPARDLAEFAPVLLVALALLPAGRVTAQTFTTIYSFTASSTNSAGVYTNGDGANPSAGLILSGNTLYGTASAGGGSGNGTVFAINTDGTGLTNLHSFTAMRSPYYTNNDGVYPYAGLILSGNTLYGTAFRGGGSGSGTMFKVNTNGTGFTNLHSFTAPDQTYYTNSDGAYPNAGLTLSGNTLYGTADSGGSSGEGTVFAINTDATGLTNLHSFTARPDYPFTNSDGAIPGTLTLSSNALYGTAQLGGSSGNGTVFALNTDGTGFTNLHSFTALDQTYYTNSDGANPVAGLLLSGNTLYGTAGIGGNSGYGTVFAINTDGTGLTNLHTFTGGTDGAYPTGLILSGNTMYGTAGRGGSSGWGTVFAMNTDGTAFTVLHNFTAAVTNAFGVYTNSDGIPGGPLILSGNTLYGRAGGGGDFGNGTIFSISFRPQLTITPSGTNVILSWPTNVAGFDYTGYTLQSTTNLLSPAAWVTNSPAPVVVNGQNVVTNPITGAQQFYRLIK